jgi:hypothetical protein
MTNVRTVGLCHGRSPTGRTSPERGVRSLRTNIAVHARGRKNAPNKIAGEKNFSQFLFGLTEQRNVRFSPAPDVLPFCRLFHLTKPSSSLERSKNNRRSYQAA